MKTTADESEDAFSGVTVPLEVERSNKTRDAVLAHSQKTYGTPKAKVEKYMEKLFEREKPPKKSDPKKPKDSGDKDSGKLHKA